MPDSVEYILDEGKYVLFDDIAEGAGDTRIWRGAAQDGDAVVVKVLPIPRDPEIYKRREGYFKDEVECGRALQSPHIRGFIDSGLVREAKPLGYPRGIWYLVFEYIAFGSLRTLLESRSLLPAEVRDLALALTAGLSVAHSHHIRHRDLKPENILLPDGRTDLAKLADFGIARTQDGTKLTSTGHWMGTARYMAPEQFKDSSAVDERADIYSLALVLWECLCADVPYDCGDASLTAEARLKAEPLDELEVKGRRLSETSAVLRQALDRNPLRRPGSVEALCDVFVDAGSRDNLWEPRLRSLTPASLVDYLQNRGLRVIDNRKLGGALWVIGGPELESLLKPLSFQGIRFVCKPEGARASSYRPAWWTAYGKER
jgi:serine/threonine-protein kinase